MYSVYYYFIIKEVLDSIKRVALPHLYSWLDFGILLFLGLNIHIFLRAYVVCKSSPLVNVAFDLA